MIFFISHGSEDKDIVRSLAESLKEMIWSFSAYEFELKIEIVYERRLIQ
jgi:hypothetical protein